MLSAASFTAWRDVPSGVPSDCSHEGPADAPATPPARCHAVGGPKQARSHASLCRSKGQMLLLSVTQPLRAVPCQTTLDGSEQDLLSGCQSHKRSGYPKHQQLLLIPNVLSFIRQHSKVARNLLFQAACRTKTLCITRSAAVAQKRPQGSFAQCVTPLGLLPVQTDQNSRNWL